jgi:hypothetical protein
VTTAPPLERDDTGVEGVASSAPVTKRRLAVATGYVLVVGVLAVLYGLYPGNRSFPLSTVSLIEGWVECLKDGLDPCTYTGYPFGVNLTLSRSVVTGAWLLDGVGVSVPAALRFLALLSIAAGVAALWFLALRLTRSHLASLAAVAVYFTSPLLVNHVGLVTLFIGFSLLPVPLTLTYLALTAERRVVAVSAAVGTLLIGLVLIYADPYPYVIGTVCATCLVLAGLVRRTRARSWPDVGMAIGVLVAVTLPALIYRALQAEAGLEVRMPPEFYRAMGADVATMFAPTEDLYVNHLLGGPLERWDPREFYGNHTHLRAAFLGTILLTTAIAGIVVLARQRGRRWLAIGLAVAAAICLILGLGPSLKIADRADRATFVDRTQELQDYLMPAELAHLTFPWSPIFDVQPFASMRATYRWHAGLRLVTALLAGITIAAVARRKRALGLGLAVLLVAESLPLILVQRRAIAAGQYEQVQQFHHDVAAAFDGHLDAGERVLFLPAANDYLVPVIAARYDVYAYNIAFDKEIERIRPRQPVAVVDAEVAQSKGALTAGQVCTLFRQDLVDAVIFTEFDPRWDSYGWPPVEGARDFLRERYTNVGLDDDPRFAIDDQDLAIIVRAAPNASGGTCAPESR